MLHTVREPERMQILGVQISDSGTNAETTCHRTERLQRLKLRLRAGREACGFEGA